MQSLSELHILQPYKNINVFLKKKNERPTPWQFFYFPLYYYLHLSYERTKERFFNDCLKLNPTEKPSRYNSFKLN